jgi:hypothetical protein
MSLWKLATAAAADTTARAKAAIEPKVPTQDTNLPLGGRIGGYMKVNGSSIFTAETLGSFVAAPSIGEVKIAAISRVRLQGWPEELGLFRYYLATGDGTDKERYIQVMTRKGKAEEVVYFTSFAKLYPDTAETLKYYSGELGNDEGLGGREWAFTRDDLKGLLSESQFASIPQGQTEVVWQRAIGDAEYVRPVHGFENRIDDAVGDKGLRQEVFCMPYQRVLEGGLVEHLFIELEVVKSHDGKKEDDVHVDFMVGIPLSISDFQII